MATCIIPELNLKNIIAESREVAQALNEFADNLRINYHMFGISKVISNEPATIVFWKDGTKTVVKCQEGDTYDLEKGILYAIIRKVYGEGREYTNILNIIDESCETYDHTKANEAFWNYEKEDQNEVKNSI